MVINKSKKKNIISENSNENAIVRDSFDTIEKKNFDDGDSFSKNNIIKKKKFIDCVVEIRRVTKVTKGGKRFRFKAYVISGDGSGMVGAGKGVGKDISVAVAKATLRARKFLFSIAKQGSTIPYEVRGEHGASYVILQPAYKGTGLIAGGSMRHVFKAAGIDDIVAKSIGTSKSATNLVKATLNALAKARSIDYIAQLRGKTKKQIITGSHHES